MADDSIQSEDLVPDYTLPDPLTFADGSAVTTAEQWQARRRELLDIFSRQVYGVTPTELPAVRVEMHADDEVFDGLGTRRQVTLHFRAGEATAAVDLLLYVPRQTNEPAATFLGLNFKGNHAVSDDEAIRVSPNDAKFSRGASATRWPAEALLQEGYALATVSRNVIAPDNVEAFRNGVLSLFAAADAGVPAAEEMGAIGAWAWALSRALDYLETVPEIDATRVIAIGHSRMGKAALWAGAQDERFAAVISNDSGCGGAALSRRRFGETVAAINTTFPHWFCGNFKQYDNREEMLPIDQHELLALIAPRPIYVASATEDLWADPRGEFLSLKHASPVYELLGADPLAADEQPPADTPVIGTMSYHLRTGRHGITEYDWQQYRRFAQQCLPSTRR